MRRPRSAGRPASSGRAVASSSGRLVQVAALPEQFGQAVHRGQGVAGDAGPGRPVDGVPAHPLGVVDPAGVEQRGAASGQHPGQQRRIVGPDRGGLRLPRVLQCPRRTPRRLPRAASAGGRPPRSRRPARHRRAVRPAALVQPGQPAPPLPCQPALAPPLVERAREEQPGAGAAAAGRPAQGGAQLVGDRVEGVEGQRHRVPVGIELRPARGHPAPGDVAVAGRRLLTGRPQAAGGVGPDRVEHPVRRAVGLEQGLVDQRRDRVQRVGAEHRLHCGQVDRAGEHRQPPEQPGGVRREGAVGPADGGVDRPVPGRAGQPVAGVAGRQRRSR